MGRLADRFGRSIDYLRVSVTDRCDLRCTYCMPKGYRGFAARPEWLSDEELERVVAVFAAAGTRRIRLTGGEPLVRRGLVRLAARLAALPGVEDLSLSTNGTLLAPLAAPLRAAGVARLNVSLDTLDRRRFAAITGRDLLPQVVEGLDAARAAGFAPIKVNMVALAGVNDDEFDAMAAYCMDRGFVLRLIETMPMGAAGRGAGYLDLEPVRERMRRRLGLVDGVVPGGGPARYLRSADGRFSVGFITPISQHFCAGCNRVRLDVEGDLHLCLGHEHRVPLRPLLRAGADGAALEAAIRAAIESKPWRHQFREAPERTARVMARTGG